MKILVVEDEPTLRETLKANLENQCFAVDVAEDAEKGSYLGRTNDYDVILLDYLMPKGTGKIVCEEVRKAGKSAYIIMLTVKPDTEAKIDALNSGADDYLVKPYSFDELLARIRAMLRRPKVVTADILTYEDLSLNTRSFTVTRGTKEIYLTRKEFMLLEYLLRNQGAVASRGMLIEHVWDSNLDAFSNTIESHILSLRRKLDRRNRPSLIQTVPGRGYKIGTMKLQPA
jgi:DNA-binding response OmpR family regulator